MIAVIFSSNLSELAGVSTALKSNDIGSPIELKSIQHFNAVNYKARGYELIFIEDSIEIEIFNLLRPFQKIDKELVFFLHASRVTYFDSIDRSFGSNSHFELSFEKRVHLNRAIKLANNINIKGVFFFKHEESCMVFPELQKIIRNKSVVDSIKKIRELTERFSTEKRKEIILNVIDCFQSNEKIDNYLEQCRIYNL